MLNAYADISGDIGYAIHARGFFTALNQLHPVCLIPKYGLSGAQQQDQTLLPMLERLLDIDLHAPAIALDYPHEMYRFGGKTRIGFTVFETTRLIPAAIHQLRQLDQVWVPTQWGRQILMNHGLAADLIRVVPEGIDPLCFHPKVAPHPQICALDGFRFLTVGKWEARKGMVELLRAFDDAFTTTDRVFLIVHSAVKVQALQSVNVHDEIGKLGLQHPEKIVIIETPLTTPHDMARLYTACDAYVSAAKAEGWGLPLLEAMACGLPVIAPNYSGPSEFLSADCAYPIPVTAHDSIFCPIFFPEPGAHGTWAHIDHEALVEKLRHVYTNRDAAKAIGATAAQQTHARWTWNHAAQKAMTHLQELSCI